MSKTRSSAPKLSEAARHIVIPSGILTTSWPSVRAECRRLGITFDPWQDGAGSIIFGRRADGSLACSIGGVVFSIPRQIGKTFFIGAIVFALCMLRPGLLVIWTAHQLATAGETHRAMAAMAEQRRVKPFIKQVRWGSGDEAVEFVNGSRILFGARERGFGLGFTKVGVLVLDEGQRLTEKTLDDLVPTMNQAVDPLMFVIGTPPRPTDNGSEFKRRRRDALAVKKAREAGEDVDFDAVYIECSADPKTRVASWEQGKVDWNAVLTANPSHPTRTPRTAVLRMRQQLTPESFQREALGVWDTDEEGSRAIAEEHWEATGVEQAPTVGVRTFAVAFSADGDRAAVAGAIKHEGGIHAELLDAAAGDVEAGLEPLADWLAARWRSATDIVLSGQAGAPTLALLLRERGVPAPVIHIATTPEYTQSCAMLLNAVKASAGDADALEAEPLFAFTHRAHEGQAQLDASVAVSDKKSRGTSGAWGFHATTEDGDETPVEAVALAYAKSRTTKRKPRGDRERKAVTL